MRKVETKRAALNHNHPFFTILEALGSLTSLKALHLQKKQKTENKRGPGGPGPPLGVENTPKGAKEAARGSSIR